MELSTEVSTITTLMEVDIGNSTESLQRFLELQKDLFHSQIDQLQNIVVTQCKLTGANPLSQEMAAGALSINIGKKPRDLLNPKAVKYMQSVFSIKDTISKKESREISALCGVTLTQVREYFASQRSRVRKFVRLAREKAIKTDAPKALQDGCSTGSDPSGPLINQAPLNSISDQAPLNSIIEQAPLNIIEQAPLNIDQAPSDPLIDQSLLNPTIDPAPLNTNINQAPLNSIIDQAQLDSVIDRTPLNTMDPMVVQEGPSSSLQEENFPGIDASDKNFVDNIFDMMRKEETFSGQVKLMEWIMRIQNASVLYWFLTKGGLMILAAWLSDATIEEQTTVLLVILKVLCHLPLQKALPLQMSAVLQTVNRLRFYRTSDISNRAKVLLTRWSKLFVRSHTLNKSSHTDSRNNILRGNTKKQRTGELINNETQSNVDLPEDIIAFSLEGSENCRKPEPSQTLKLLTAPGDDSNKRNMRGGSFQSRERRKVLLVEQPGRNTTDRSLQVARPVNSNQGRPMSADDIQKAKMRAMFMRSKYGKSGTSPKENQQPKTEGSSRASVSQLGHLVSPSVSSPARAKNEDMRKPSVPSSGNSPVRPQNEEMKESVILPSETTTVRPQIEEMRESVILPSETSSVRPQIEEMRENVVFPSVTSPVRPHIEEMEKPVIPASQTSPFRPQLEEMRDTVVLPLGASPVRPEIEDIRKPLVFPSETTPTSLETSIRSKSSSSPQDRPSLDKLKRDRISWQMPPEIKINSLWRVGVGENSKEIEIQSNRMRRERETIYQRIQDIPSDPKKPWDQEMDYDDTLTPEIPTEQPVDVDAAENNSLYHQETVTGPSTSYLVPVSTGSVAEPEPDLELLAVLLKNPDLVFALTSGQGGNISSEETVKLLDMIKKNGLGQTTGVSNGFVGGNHPTNLDMTSLPSPTPPSEIRMNRWRSEVAKDPIPQSIAVAASHTISVSDQRHPTGLMQPKNPVMKYHMQQAPSNQHHQPVLNSDYYASGLNQQASPPSSFPNYQAQRRTNPSINQVQQQSTMSSLQQNILAAALPLLQPEASYNYGQMHNHIMKPATVPTLQEPAAEMSWQWNEVSRPSWERNEYVREQDIRYSSPDRSLDYGNGWDNTGGSGSGGGQHSRSSNWSRRRDIDRRDLPRNGGSRTWRR
ncbi:hypothetical protein MKW94_002632 [Papaver nudicaule]|uniref:Homeobox domain-containing protein n=1 Tax=Papaver nudicaule TaxID=74823 RepID=A0AA41S9E7_PAPNU|nr:hypothetical protein [Papaver nudicaule]